PRDRRSHFRRRRLAVFAVLGQAGMAALARRPHLFPDRVREPPAGHAAVGNLVLDQAPRCADFSARSTDLGDRNTNGTRITRISCLLCFLCSCPGILEGVTPIINAQGLTKTYGIVPLFQNISFTVSEGDRIGVIGPNGSGKSTLMQILCGIVQPDSGEVAVRKRAKLGYIAQNSSFEPGATAASVVQRALDRASIRLEEQNARMAETLGRAGFTDFQVAARALSGGWQKRLAIVEGLVQAPDILFL